MEVHQVILPPFPPLPPPTEPPEPPTPPQTLTITVPSLGYVATIDQNTSLNEITNTRRDLASQCVQRYLPFSTQANTCNAEVTSAYNQAINFINR